MKILSWDVGIIHLAYCLMEIEDNKITILKWENINLLEEKPEKCHGFITQSGERLGCDRKCTHLFQNSLETIHFCTLHKKQFQKINKKCLEIKKIRTDETCQKKKAIKQFVGKKVVSKFVVGMTRNFYVNFIVIYYKEITINQF